MCVGVKNTTHFIARGDMYIFQPTQEYHSVGAPSGTDAEERCAIALRYYRKDRPDAAQDLVWSPAVLDKEDLRVRQEARQKEGARKQLFEVTNSEDLVKCPKCHTPNLPGAPKCLVQSCQAQMNTQDIPPIQSTEPPHPAPPSFIPAPHVNAIVEHLPPTQLPIIPPLQVHAEPVPPFIEAPNSTAHPSPVSPTAAI